MKFPPLSQLFSLYAKSQFQMAEIDSSLQTLIWLLQNPVISENNGSFYSLIQIPENLDSQTKTVQSFRKTKVYIIKKHCPAPTGMAPANNWFLGKQTVSLMAGTQESPPLMLH